MQRSILPGRAPASGPERAEGLDRITSQTLEVAQSKSNTADSAGASHVGQPCAETIERKRVEQHDKRIANARARAALAGAELHVVVTDGGSEFLATRWNLVRTLPDIAAVETWLDAIAGGAR